MFGYFPESSLATRRERRARSVQLRKLVAFRCRRGDRPASSGPSGAAPSRPSGEHHHSQLSEVTSSFGVAAHHSSGAAPDFRISGQVERHVRSPRTSVLHCQPGAIPCAQAIASSAARVLLSPGKRPRSRGVAAPLSFPYRLTTGSVLAPLSCTRGTDPPRLTIPAPAS